jgi:hypothetical protein
MRRTRSNATRGVEFPALAVSDGAQTHRKRGPRRRVPGPESARGVENREALGFSNGGPYLWHFLGRRQFVLSQGMLRISCSFQK